MSDPTTVPEVEEGLGDCDINQADELAIPVWDQDDGWTDDPLPIAQVGPRVKARWSDREREEAAR